MFQQTARLVGMGGIHGVVAFIDLTNDALSIDDEGDAIREKMREVQNTIGLGSGLFSVAQERERGPDFLGEFAVPLRTVNADADDLCARRIEFGDITLIRLQFFRSARCRSTEVKGKHDALLATKITQANRPAALVGQGEVRGRVADFE